MENKVKQIIDEIKMLECKIKAIGEIVTTLQQDNGVVSMATRRSTHTQR